MAYGFTIQSASGKYVVTDDDQVPVFHNKYAITTGYTTYRSIDTGIPISDSFVLAFIRGAIDGLWVFKGSTNYMIGHYGGNGTIYTFRAPFEGMDAGSYGVKIYRQSGGIAYQNTRKHLRVIDAGEPITYLQNKTYSVPIAVPKVSLGVWTDDEAASSSVAQRVESLVATTANKIIIQDDAKGYPAVIGNTAGVWVPVIDVTGL